MVLHKVMVLAWSNGTAWSNGVAWSLVLYQVIKICME